MKNDKYYTPEISEFYIGFEYEYLPMKYLWYLNSLAPKGTWQKEKFAAGAGNDGESEAHELDNLINDKAVRVKYLDKSDIESLGWKLLTVEETIFGYTLYCFKKSHINLYTVFDKDNKIRIWWDEFEPTIKFNLELLIKNKSELKVLMKQLGI